MSRMFLGSLLCAAGMIVLVGCGASVDRNGPETVPTSITVTYNGAPAAGAKVTFKPTGSQERGAVATTNDQGQADMWAFEPGGGVIPGSYAVTISKLTVPSMPDPDSVSPEEYEKAQAEYDSLVPEHELPEKYNSPDTSGLTAEVSDEGGDSITFDLTD